MSRPRIARLPLEPLDRQPGRLDQVGFDPVRFAVERIGGLLVPVVSRPFRGQLQGGVEHADGLRRRDRQVVVGNALDCLLRPLCGADLGDLDRRRERVLSHERGHRRILTLLDGLGDSRA